MNLDLTKEHLESPEPECRWCFAIDSVRVKGEDKKLHKFDDALIEHLSCPRCGGEFTRYNEGFGEDYLRERILKLHPELSESLDRKTIESIVT